MAVLRLGIKASDEDLRTILSKAAKGRSLVGAALVAEGTAYGGQTSRRDGGQTGRS